METVADAAIAANREKTKKTRTPSDIFISEEPTSGHKQSLASSSIMRAIYKGEEKKGQ